MCAAARSRGALGRELTRLLRVVAAAIVRDGRVLAAHRVRPMPGWEFPGGKVEPGESAAAAIERECGEELGVEVRAVSELATAAGDEIELVLWRVRLVSGEPEPLQGHDEVRWLSRDELDGLAWLPADRELLSAVDGMLR